MTKQERWLKSGPAVGTDRAGDYGNVWEAHSARGGLRRERWERRHLGGSEGLGMKGREHVGAEGRPR